jgi:type 1 fimbria pilin
VFIVEHNKDGIVVKLGDFGIATFQTDGTDTYVGSKKFMAPVKSCEFKVVLCTVLIGYRSSDIRTTKAGRRLPKATSML